MKKAASSTSFKETALGVIPRRKLIMLEVKGIQKEQNYRYYSGINLQNS